jgi:tetratricopeptide (TPR) repeat protein
LACGQEAVDIFRRLAETKPDAVLPDLARGLTNLGVDLSDLGRREEALAATQEAIDIRRRLAETRPDAFLPDLATSLGALNATLAAAGRHGEAAAAAREGLAAIASFVERHPQAFGDLAQALARDHVAACEKAGAKPDKELLGRIAHAVRANVSTADDPSRR